MDNTLKNSRSKTRKLVVIGMLGGISIFLGLTPLGIIHLPVMNLTIMHIPVIIGALLEGPLVGGAIGLIFGLFSMYQNITAPNLTSFIFMNPIIALLPRILIGIVTYYLYTFIKNKIKNKSISIGVASIAGTLTNTIGVLGLTYILYLDRYAAAKQISTDMVAGALLTVIGTNGVAEAIASAVITIPVVTAISKIRKF